MAAPETRIIGAVLLEQRKVMVSLAGGEAAFAEVLAGLPRDRREEYEAVSMLSWCRHSTATEVVVRLGERLGKRPEVMQAEVVRAGVEETFSGVWRVLLRLSSDDALIKRAALLYAKACDRGKMAAEPLGPGRVRLTLTEWPEIPDLGAIALAAGIEAMLRVVGRVAVITWTRERAAVVFDVRATPGA